MLNCIILQGRLGDTPELRHTQTGKSVANVSLAVSRSRKDKNGEYLTDWFKLVFWNGTAEYASQRYKKGDLVIVRGRMESRTWDDDDGKKHYLWEVQVETIDPSVIKPKEKANENETQAYGSPDITQSYEVPENDFTELSESDDDVPF